MGLFERLHGGFVEARNTMNQENKSHQGVMYVEVEGMEELRERLERLRTTHPEMKADLKKIMRVVIKQARKDLLKISKSEVGSGYANSQGDQRKAYRAIKSMVYKRIFGGNVNIMSKKSAGKYRASLPPKKIQHGRGGNRRERSERTIRMMSYWGEDRGFILRWLNNGTARRQIRTENNTRLNKMVMRGTTSASLDKKRTGNRGKIDGTNWFGTSSVEEMNKMSEYLTKLIDRAITEVWGADAITKAKVRAMET